MLSELLNESNCRYERKFVIVDLTKEDVESLIKLHPALFSEIYHQRFVNNIYFDSHHLSHYYDNINGSVRRLKVRIRWYGELFGKINNPVLEIKMKNGLLGHKATFSIQSMQFNDDFDFRNLVDDLNRSDIPEDLKLELKNLKASLLNRYSRKYFLSADGKFRMTLDTDLISYRIDHFNNSFLHQTDHKNIVILELKYGQDMDDHADLIVRHFPFRLTKSSKYVSGIECVFQT